MAVLIETSMGDLVIDLYVKECPLASKNFIKLCKQKFYNGALFTNLQKNYLTRIQTLESPKTIFSTQYFEDESLNVRKHDRIGIIATTNTGPNQNNSDFYITLSSDDLEALNERHSIFGQVQEGLQVLSRINELHVDDHNRPLLNVRIKHTVVLDDPFDDPVNMEFPSRSPSPPRRGFGRLEYDEKEDVIVKQQGQPEMIKDDEHVDIIPPENVLYACRLNPVTKEENLEIIFSKFGLIKSCDVVRDWKTGQSLQYAFIEFETTAQCEEAYLKMENALIDDRRIHVDFCQSQAKQWSQLKISQRKKKLLNDQRGNYRSGNNTNQNTIISQLEVKIDYFNTINNHNYIVEVPAHYHQQKLEQIVEKKKDPTEKKKESIEKKKHRSRSRSHHRSKDKNKKHKHQHKKI